MTDLLKSIWDVLVGLYWILAVVGLMCGGFLLVDDGPRDDKANERAGCLFLLFVLWEFCNAVGAVWYMRTH